MSVDIKGFVDGRFDERLTGDMLGLVGNVHVSVHVEDTMILQPPCLGDPE